MQPIFVLALALDSARQFTVRDSTTVQIDIVSPAHDSILVVPQSASAMDVPVKIDLRIGGDAVTDAYINCILVTSSNSRTHS